MMTIVEMTRSQVAGVTSGPILLPQSQMLAVASRRSTQKWPITDRPGPAAEGSGKQVLLPHPFRFCKLVLAGQPAPYSSGHGGWWSQARMDTSNYAQTLSMDGEGRLKGEGTTRAAAH